MKSAYKGLKRSLGLGKKTKKQKAAANDEDSELAAVVTAETRSRAVTVIPDEAFSGLWQTGDDAAKDAFLEREWAPFVAEISAAVADTRRRHESGVSFEAVLPPQRLWAEWTTTCRELTATWHGAPNVSMVYEALVECSEHDGESPYRFEQVPRTRSEDLWVRALDGRVRGSFYGAGVARPDRRDALKQQIGESPIDNVVLPAVLTARARRVGARSFPTRRPPIPTPPAGTRRASS